MNNNEFINKYTSGKCISFLDFQVVAKKYGIYFEKINNDELTEICIDSLKLYCIPKFENIIKNNPNVLKIIHDKNNFQSNFTRTVIEQVMQILNFRS